MNVKNTRQTYWCYLSFYFTDVLPVSDTSFIFTYSQCLNVNISWFVLFLLVTCCLKVFKK